MRLSLLAGTRLLVALLAGWLVAGGSAAASASSSPRSPCGPKAATTLAASHTARAYAQHGVVYGCSAHGTIGYRLGRRDSCTVSIRVAPVRVTGDLVAFGAERCGIDTRTASVIVLRLTDGKRLLSTPATGPLGVESFQQVDSLVLGRDGAVAWIGEGSSVAGHGRRTVEVRKLDKQGLSVLDSGQRVRTGSLRLRRATLRWRHGEHRRTTTLH
jgi:hypothetical protein